MAVSVCNQGEVEKSDKITERTFCLKLTNMIHYFTMYSHKFTFGVLGRFILASF